MFAMPAPDDQSFSETAAALRVVLGKLTRRLRTEASSDELTSAQKIVLTHLEQVGPTTISGLARIDGVRPQSMSATVSALEAGGFVAGAPDPRDGRQTLYSLTPAWLEALRVGRAAREDWLFRAMKAKLSADEVDELAHALHLVARLVE
jgi:DNA-binding MarR family transcriptional regulator